jgi:putative nucleotidyltransferase with HDIG domain
MMDAKAVVPRAATNGRIDLDAAIVDLVSRGAVKIPPYPAVAMKVEQLVRRQDFGLAELTKLVASDQALAADALRLANSAYFSRGTPVTSLNAAIGRIGAKEVSRLALASGLGVHANKPGPLSSLKRRVWLEALASAALAQELARKRGLAAEEAFACGLLHDFGKMIAIACIEEVVEGERAAPQPIESWMEVVDRYHVELGLALAAQWDLPQLVSDVISLHHAEDASAAAEPRLLEVVMASDEVVRLLNDRIWLTPEDLGAVSSLTGPECDLVSRVLDRLPTFIASFESGKSVAPSSRSLIEPRSPGTMSGPTPVSFAVSLTVHREVREYRAIGIASHNLMISGTWPLPENVLMEMKLGSTPPLLCWATAKLSWNEGGAHVVLLQPFALNGPAQEIWKGLVRQTASA